jgi:hypothetical protein
MAKRGRLPRKRAFFQKSFREGDIVRAAYEAKKSAAMLGVAFDNDDGETRMTRGKNFLLVGGKEETHAVLQETAVKINEQLDKRGKRLEDVSAQEFGSICRDVVESIRPS